MTTTRLKLLNQHRSPRLWGSLYSCPAALRDTQISSQSFIFDPPALTYTRRSIFLISRQFASVPSGLSNILEVEFRDIVSKLLIISIIRNVLSSRRAVCVSKPPPNCFALLCSPALSRLKQLTPSSQLLCVLLRLSRPCDRRLLGIRSTRPPTSRKDRPRWIRMRDARKRSRFIVHSSAKRRHVDT